MTDKEIIKALEICENYKETCEYCPYDNIRHCADEIRKDALDLIKRQQTEIEDKFEIIGQQGRYIKSLKEENEKIKTKIYKMAIDKALAENARVEAIKEFARKLKENSRMHSDLTGRLVAVVYAYEIDDIAKEMVGGDNDK